ncbi:hypothetical protein T484DRAFT_1822388, partial [Baffinella frigidus]
MVINTPPVSSPDSPLVNRAILLGKAALFDLPLVGAAKAGDVCIQCVAKAQEAGAIAALFIQDGPAISATMRISATIHISVISLSRAMGDRLYNWTGVGNKVPDPADPPPSSNPPHVAVSFWKPSFFVDAPDLQHAAPGTLPASASGSEAGAGAVDGGASPARSRVLPNHSQAAGEVQEERRAPSTLDAAGEETFEGSRVGEGTGGGGGGQEDASGRLRAFWWNILTTDPKGKAWITKAESKVASTLGISSLSLLATPAPPLSRPVSATASSSRASPPRFDSPAPALHPSEAASTPPWLELQRTPQVLPTSLEHAGTAHGGIAEEGASAFVPYVEGAEMGGEG